MNCFSVHSVSVPVVSLEKMPCLNRSESAHIKVDSVSPTPGSSLASSSSCSSSSSPSSASLKSGLASPASHKNQEKLLNGRGPVTPRSTTPPSLNDKRPSPLRSPMEKRPAASPSSLERKPPTSTSPSVLDRRLLTPPSTPDRKHQNGAKGVRNRRVSGGLMRFFTFNKREEINIKKTLVSLRSVRSCSWLLCCLCGSGSLSVWSNFSVRVSSVEVRRVVHVDFGHSGLFDLCFLIFG